MPAETLLLAVVVLAAAVVIIYFVFHLRFERWKAAYEHSIRRDSVQKSQATTLGMVSEQLAPYFPQFQWNPKDARFLGWPVDFIVFDGLSDDYVKEVVFVEVKTGSASLNPRERLVHDAISRRRVRWHQLTLPASRRHGD